MDRILFIAALLVILKVFYNVFRILLVKYWRYKQHNRLLSKKVDVTDLPAFVILIPILREQAIVRQILSTARGLVDSYHGEIEIILICSKRERLDYRNELEPTYNLLKSELSWQDANKIILIESDGTDKYKSDQLRQAIKYTKQYGLAARCRNNVFIGVYDADSEPELTVLQEVANFYIDSGGRIKAFQQTPIYINRLDRFPVRLRALLNDVLCLNRILYSYKFSFKEVFGYLFSGTAFDFRLSHFTGHGYFVHLDLLDKAGGFLPPSCDTTLGYRLSYMGERIQPLTSWDISEVPNSYRDVFFQGIIWFNGCELYRRELNSLRDKGDNRLTDKKLIIAKTMLVFFTNLSWSCLPIIWALLFIIAIVTTTYLKPWLLAVALWLILQIILWTDIIFLTKKIKRTNFGWLIIFSVPIVSPIAVVLGCLSPLSYYFYKIVRRKIPRRKTTRSKDSIFIKN